MARRIFSLSMVGLVAAVIASLANVSPAASNDGGTAETTGSVARTHSNYTNAGGQEGPQIASNATINIRCRITGFAVENGNTWWYQIASDPWNDQFFVSADAFYNNGSTSGPLHGTPWVDEAVPVCGESPTQPSAPSTTSAPPTSQTSDPTATPSVHLDQGPLAPRGYRYAVTISGFAAGTRVSISCRDQVDSEGFFTFTLTAGADGRAATDKQCYSDESGSHWVVADGRFESNHVGWYATTPAPTPSSSSAPAQNISAAPQPETPTPSPSASLAPSCATPTGDRIENRGWVWYSLYDHYVWANGNDAYIDWSFFSSRPDFVAWAKALPEDGSNHYYTAPYSDLDLYLSLRTFTVVRDNIGCYSVSDVYDFRPNDIKAAILGGNDFSLPKAAIDLFLLPFWALQLSGAREYTIRAYGSL